MLVSKLLAVIARREPGPAFKRAGEVAGSSVTELCRDAGDACVCIGQVPERIVAPRIVDQVAEDGAVSLEQAVYK